MQGDADIASALDSVKLALEQSEMRMIDAPPAPQDEPRALAHAPERTPGPSGRAEAAPMAHTKSHQTAMTARVPGTQGNARDDGDYTIAYEAFGVDEAWTVRDLASVLKVAESTARKTKIAWENEHLISGQGLSNGRYRFIA